MVCVCVCVYVREREREHLSAVTYNIMQILHSLAERICIKAVCFGKICYTQTEKQEL